MKFMRILAMLLALMLMGTVCFAEEPAEAPSEDTATAESTEEYGIHSAILLPAMELTYEDWLSNAEVRAMFAVLFQLEMSSYEDEYMVSSLLDTYGIPTIFLSEVSGELNGYAISMYLFFEDTESENESSMLVTGTYLVEEGFFNGFVMEMEGDPTLIMDLLSTTEGAEFEYYPVTFEEYYEALLAIDSIINGEE